MDTDQLQAIQRLLADPLRQAVRAEMELGHDRLAAGIERVADQLSAHAAAARDSAHRTDQRLQSLERRVTLLEKFKTKILAVYTALAFVLSVALSLFRDWASAAIKKR